MSAGRPRPHRGSSAQAVEVAPATCPCCKGTLYLAQPHDQDGRRLWIASGGTPGVKSDAKGAYLTCQHCFKRISITVLRESAEGTTLEISKRQECD